MAPALLGLATWGLAALWPSPAFGTVLDGFAINTEDKAVTVTLFTDQRTQYTTETQDKQFSIILPNTQLSPEQLNNGLPVVIDNKNRFIGRAVPTEDGRVKIILPNLPANDYSVSVLQRKPGQKPAVATAKSKPVVLNASQDNQFEQVAARFSKPTVASRAPVSSKPTGMTSKNTDETTTMRLSAPPSILPATDGTVWNPYVVKQAVKPQAVPKISNSPYSNYRPVARQPQRRTPQHIPPPIINEPINTVSVAESTHPVASGDFNNPDFNPNPAPPPLPGSTASNPLDPLPLLHALDGVNPAKMPFDNLQGLAQDNPFIGAIRPLPAIKTVPPTSVVVKSSLIAELKEAIEALPQWLLVTMGLFMGGMGLFMLVGGLVLLRLLFVQARQGFLPPQTIVLPPGVQFATTDLNQAQKSPYASAPEPVSTVTFQDSASVNAMDYLKKSPSNVAQAVHNTALLKFPARGRRAVGARVASRVR